MRKKAAIILSLCMIASLTACGNKDKPQETTEIVTESENSSETTQDVTENDTSTSSDATTTESDATIVATETNATESDAAMIVSTGGESIIDTANKSADEEIVRNESFVLYGDGRNNLVDDAAILTDGGTTIEDIPTEYRNYQTLFHHSFDFMPKSGTEIMKTEYAQLIPISKYGGSVVELEIDTFDYRIREVLPYQFVYNKPVSQFLDEDYKYDESLNIRNFYTTIMYNYEQPDETDMNNLNTGSYMYYIYGNDLFTENYEIAETTTSDKNTFINFMKNDVADFEVSDTTDYILKSDDTFNHAMATNVTCYKGTEKETKGLFVISYDKTRHTFIRQYFGIPTADIEKNKDTILVGAFQYDTLLDEMANNFRMIRK